MLLWCPSQGPSALPWPGQLPLSSGSLTSWPWHGPARPNRTQPPRGQAEDKVRQFLWEIQMCFRQLECTTGHGGDGEEREVGQGSDWCVEMLPALGTMCFQSIRFNQEFAEVLGFYSWAVWVTSSGEQSTGCQSCTDSCEEVETINLLLFNSNREYINNI